MLSQGERVFSYYGNYDINLKPRTGIDKFMINEYVEKAFEGQAVIFKEDLRKMLSSNATENKRELKKIAEQLKKANELIADCYKFITMVVEENKLSFPQLSIKKTKS